MTNSMKVIGLFIPLYIVNINTVESITCISERDIYAAYDDVTRDHHIMHSSRSCSWQEQIHTAL